MHASRKEVRIVTPVVDPGYPDEYLAPLRRDDFDVTQVQIRRGPRSLESEFEESIAVPDTLEQIVIAERDGADAVVIDCMRDPGLGSGRELVSIPVVGVAEATMHVASMLGHTFSVVSVLDRLVPAFENLAKTYGVRGKLASVRSVDIPVLSLAEDGERLLHALVEQSIRAIEDDGAHAIVFGCTGMIGFAQKVQEGLAAKSYEGVPVIDPIPTGVRVAQLLVDLGLTHSKRTYPAPAGEWYEGFTFPDPRRSEL